MAGGPVAKRRLTGKWLPLQPSAVPSKTPAEVAVRCYSSLMSCKRSAEGNHLAPSGPFVMEPGRRGLDLAPLQAQPPPSGRSGMDPTYQYDWG
jgi:hypothetical protein